MMLNKDKNSLKNVKGNVFFQIIFYVTSQKHFELGYSFLGWN